ncbi:MAG TPA: hypothetical protein VLU47_02410 [Blastocatellia bacterium]|nr:hypothetical protein [Blastocatellia bacterium]
MNKAKIRKAQKLLGTKTDSETIDRALDEVISERKRSARALAATERFIKSGVEMKDVFGRLTDSKA